MSQEPWNEEIYTSEEKSRKARTEKGNKANLIFTILAVVFCIIVTGITVLAIYLSSGGSSTNSTEEFYNSKNASSSAAVASESSSTSETEAPASTQETPAPEETVPSSTEQPAETAGETIVVQPGEGQSSIAARAGISIADLERLNPDKMSTGSWLAHPGDTVRIK
ncbi:SAG1386/EF1546 family surface-associated protein [Streptococcus cameli]